MENSIDWANLGFGYIKTDYRYVSNFKNGKWDDGNLTTDETVGSVSVVIYPLSFCNSLVLVGTVTYAALPSVTSTSFTYTAVIPSTSPPPVIFIG